MKIKIFDYETKNVEKMEEDINKFIKNKKVIDIKHQSAGENCNYWHTAIVMYK